MAESKLINNGLIEVDVIDGPEEAFRKIMEMWPKKQLKRRDPSFRDLHPWTQKYLEEQCNKIFGKKTGKN